MNSNELLGHLKPPNLNFIKKHQFYDLSTFNTITPHHKSQPKAGSQLPQGPFIVLLYLPSPKGGCFLITDDLFCSSCMVDSSIWFLCCQEPLFVKDHSNFKSKYNEEDIIKVFEFLVEIMFVVFAGKFFQQIFDRPMSTNFVIFLSDIFLFSYGEE